MKKLLLKFSVAVLVLLFSTFSVLKAQSNQYLNFDGVNDWDSVPNASALVTGATAMSITGWFFDNNLNYGQGLMGFRTGTESFYLISLNNGQIEARFINSANVTSQPTIPTGTIIPNIWQHFAFVYDGTKTYFYQNGALVSSATASGSLTIGTTPFAIGKSTLGTFNFYYNGNIDEVTLWKKALTQAEISAMMTTEPIGNEPNLLLYYKFNQGVPGGNNTGITTLHNEVAANSPLYDAVLNNFALTGTTSNFEGTLNSHFQAISFPQISTKLTTDPPFYLHASASSGLKVSYTVLSGPATISSDSLVTLTGAGTVSIKAYQNGNAQYDTASPVINTFDVVNPSANAPIVEARHPLNGMVYMPTLSKIQLAAIASINYPSLFSVQEVHFKIGGVTYPAHDFGNGHYTTWWQPSAYGNYAIDIIATSNYGTISTTTSNIIVASNAVDTVVTAFSGVLININVGTQEIDGVLPSYVGAYDTIIATLNVTCPTGGCGEWDHTASIDAKSHEGNWFEIIRYITPYSTACTHSISVTDYMSLLTGKVKFRVSCATLDNGYNYELKFTYKAGTPPHKYSQVNQIWRASYDFGNYANQQPVGVVNYTYPANVADCKLKLISTGHMGPNNTSNAAEFYEATHHIYINNVNTFSQHNWTTCNPNPDNCMPQNGTWTYNRAGWCPGSIAKPFDYAMQPYISSGTVALKYIFYESYIDQCNPNYPPCVTSSSCTDCADGANPFLVVACNLVNFFDSIPPNPGIQNISEAKKEFGISVYPNPSNGKFKLEANTTPDKPYNVEVYNMAGNVIKQFTWKGEDTYLDLSSYTLGIYLLKISNSSGVETKKLILQ
ncbi:MAG: LamG-like jellyroll fold domain-containing protein [Bacteroidota bacterium]